MNRRAVRSQSQEPYENGIYSLAPSSQRSASLRRRVGVLAVAAVLAALPVRATAQSGCPPTTGQDGTATISGIINRYYPGLSGNAATQALTIVSMGQGNATHSRRRSRVSHSDAGCDHNSTNGIAYGDGSTGSGSTNLNSAGFYEYVRVTNLGTAGRATNLTITGAGTGNGLINTYHAAAGPPNASGLFR